MRRRVASSTDAFPTVGKWPKAAPTSVCPDLAAHSYSSLSAASLELSNRCELSVDPRCGLGRRRRLLSAPVQPSPRFMVKRFNDRKCYDVMEENSTQNSWRGSGGLNDELDEVNEQCGAGARGSDVIDSPIMRTTL